MRTVFLFPSGTPDEARRTLDAAFPRNGRGEEWLVDRSIWVRIVDPPFWDDWSAEQIELVERAIGDRDPGAMIQADVSGRIDGQKEVVRLCRVLLKDGGVATDDYSDRCWSLTEILNSVGSAEGFFRPRANDDDASSDGTFPLTIVHTDYGMCLTTTQFADWREVQDAFSGYKASLGPWSVTEILEYVPIEYPTEQPFTAEAVRALADAEDATLWSRQLTEDERTNVPANVRAVAAAAGELLDRLDDLYDERPDSLVRLLSSIDEHMPDVRESALGSVATDARSRLTDAQRAQLSASALNRQALAATDELRLVCAATWAEDSAHAAVEHERLDELRGLLDSGWDVDDPTDDGMTLLHHAIDIEVDAAAQTGEQLAVELIELLVVRGADLGHRWQGRTPLEAAHERGHHLAVTVIEAARRSVPGGGTSALLRDRGGHSGGGWAMSERDVWSFYESLGSGDRAHLTKVEQEVAAICDLRQEVNSGGFDGYFRFWGGDTAEVAASAIGRILGDEWADVLLDAVALLGPVYPRTANEREAVLSDAVSEALESFDARYFDLEASVDADGLLTAELRRD